MCGTFHEHCHVLMCVSLYQSDSEALLVMYHDVDAVITFGVVAYNTGKESICRRDDIEVLSAVVPLCEDICRSP